MQISNVTDNKNNRYMTSAFLGYNHNPVISDGELFDTTNLTCDHYPLMSPRNLRKKVAEVVKNWVERSLVVPTPETHEQGGRMYYEYFVSLGPSFSEDHKVSFTFTSDFIMNYVELYVLKKVKTISGNEQIEKYLLSKIYPSDMKTSIEFNNTYVQEATDIELHIVGHSTTETNITSLKYYTQSGTIRGILIKDNKICYMINKILYYDSLAYDLTPYFRESDTGEKVKLLSYGSKILIFPCNIYFDTISKECGSLGSWFTVENTTINYKLTTIDGAAISPTVGPDAPEDPSNKDYWIDTSSGSHGLYQYSVDLMMWVAIPTTYIKVTVPDKNFADKFNEGDAVFISETSIENIKDGSIIQGKGSNDSSSYIIITGLIESEVNDPVTSCTFERKIPDLDFVCISNNRVWGCHYGVRDGQMINEIYASKLGDATNWYVFEGISTDSYALSLGDDGEFTGCTVYNGYPLFFKENSIYKMYGNYPAAYQLLTYDCRGCQKGCDESIQIVGEYVMYKSNRDVCIFNGESPNAISNSLGLDRFDDATAGVSIDKYYISMRNKTTGQYMMFVYDISKGLWIKEDTQKIEQFSSNKSGTLYGHDGNKIYAFVYDNENLDADEEYVEWEAITSEYNIDFPDRTYLSRITIRAEIPFDAEITVAISYDDKPFEVQKTVRGVSDITSHSLTISTKRCDHYRLKLSGHGDVKVYSITRMFNQGGETNGLENR